MENLEKDTENPMKGYDSTDRDFQRTENEIDNISASEKEAINEKEKDGKNKKADFNNKPDIKE